MIQTTQDISTKSNFPYIYYLTFSVKLAQSRVPEWTFMREENIHTCMSEGVKIVNQCFECLVFRECSRYAYLAWKSTHFLKNFAGKKFDSSKTIRNKQNFQNVAQIFFSQLSTNVLAKIF